VRDEAHEIQGVSIETQLPTPPNESAPEGLTSELPVTQHCSTWNFRSISSNAGSSISSPPADDPDYDELPYSHNLLRQLSEGVALKASPTSSNEADPDLDPDLDTDLDPEDIEWDQPASVAQFPSPDESFSDIGKSNWSLSDSKEENPFDEAIIVQQGDIDTKDLEGAQ